MSSSTLLNPATGRIFGSYLPTGISIPTDQLSSPCLLGTTTSLADDGAGTFYVQDTRSGTGTYLSVGDGTGVSTLVGQTEIQFGVPAGVFQFANFDGPASARLQNIRLLNALPVPATSAVAEVVSVRTWATAGIPVLAQNIPTYASTGQRILLEVSAQLRLSPTTPFVGADTALSLVLTGIPGVVVSPPPVPAFSSNLLLQYQNGAVSAQTYQITFSVIVNATTTPPVPGTPAPWSLFLTASSTARSYTATFQDAVLLKATTLAN